MRLVTYQSENAPAVGAVTGDAVIPLPAFASLQALLDAGPAGLAEARRAVESAPSPLPLGAVRLLPPLPRPGKILALAGNYAAHRAEGGVGEHHTTKALPEVFCKPVTSIVGHGGEIVIPTTLAADVDYEGELGVVIGARCDDVPEAEALRYVAGYLCVNDVSARRIDPGYQREPAIMERARFYDWLIGKWPNTFCPIGPWLATADEVPDPMALRLVTRVNGEVRQDASTGDMIHTIARQISYCSQLMTLEPGDVIATGTPSGVGFASGRFLRPGDVVEVEIERVGTLRNTVRSK